MLPKTLTTRMFVYISIDRSPRVPCSDLGSNGSVFRRELDVLPRFGRFPIRRISCTGATASVVRGGKDGKCIRGSAASAVGSVLRDSQSAQWEGSGEPSGPRVRF